ncbi:MAG: Bax inhibitor-1/YccA family protein [Bacteroidetes bacterium]|nr:Bax inhibitor-1/YccA family protein [Bacteroidia bacterium]MBN8695655.1 Bax inhibitor-1/YccA family protein [Bacteroidota bacterium]
METNNFNFVQSHEETTTMSKTFLASVFSWMFAALTITSIVAYSFANNLELLSLLVNVERGGLSILGYVVMFAPIGFVFAMSLGFNRFSYPVILFLFLLYSAVMGASLSFIFLAYTASSIYGTFAAAAGMFGLMAVVGYTTKTDLTKFGSIMMMGLMGIILASIINWFIGSEGLDYIISFIGVLVFTGLTAYDVQKLKRIGAGVEFGTATTSKLVIMGALNLYLDFINLFLMLLRLFGDRK